MAEDNPSEINYTSPFTSKEDENSRRLLEKYNEIQRKIAEIEELETKLYTSETKLSHLEEVVKRLKNENSELKKNMARKDSEVLSLLNIIQRNHGPMFNLPEELQGQFGVTALERNNSVALQKLLEEKSALQQELKSSESAKSDLKNYLTGKEITITLLESEMRHLKEKMQENDEKLKKKEEKVRDLKNKLERTHSAKSETEIRLLEKNWEGKYLENDLEKKTEILKEKSSQLKEKEKCLVDENMRLKEIEKEKHEKELMAMKTAMDINVAREQKETEARLLKEQKEKDDKKLNQMTETMQNLLFNFAPGAGASSFATGRRLQALPSLRGQGRKYSLKDLPEKINVIFYPKGKNCVYQEFHLNAQDGEDFEKFLHTLFTQHNTLAQEITLMQRQNYLEAIHGAHYAILIPDRNRGTWVAINSFDDVLCVYENDPESKEPLKFCIVHEEEKDMRLDELLFLEKE